MNTCSYRKSCRFYQKQLEAGAESRQMQQLSTRYCEEGRAESCAIRQHFERTGTHPPANLFPDGSRFIDRSQIFRLALTALTLALIAGLLTIYFLLR